MNKTQVFVLKYCSNWTCAREEMLSSNVHGVLTGSLSISLVAASSNNAALTAVHWVCVSLQLFVDVHEISEAWHIHTDAHRKMNRHSDRMWKHFHVKSWECNSLVNQVCICVLCWVSCLMHQAFMAHIVWYTENMEEKPCFQGYYS